MEIKNFTAETQRTQRKTLITRISPPARQFVRRGQKTPRTRENAKRMKQITNQGVTPIVLLKVGRTIADLDHSKDVHQEHISEAAQYRNLDRDLWR